MSIVTPNISNYKPFYFQTGSDESATDTTSYGMVAKSNPFPVLPSPKSPYKNDWSDENGDDEYTNKIYYEAFDFSVSFYIKATESSAGAGDAQAVIASQVQSFFSRIKDGTFMTFDSYTGVGYAKVRYNGFKEESFKSRNGGAWARAIFSITFKVLDPLARTKMQGTAIVEA